MPTHTKPPSSHANPVKGRRWGTEHPQKLTAIVFTTSVAYGRLRQDHSSWALAESQDLPVPEQNTEGVEPKTLSRQSRHITKGPGTPGRSRDTTMLITDLAGLTTQ